MLLLAFDAVIKGPIRVCYPGFRIFRLTIQTRPSVGFTLETEMSVLKLNSLLVDTFWLLVDIGLVFTLRQNSMGGRQNGQ